MYDAAPNKIAGRGEPIQWALHLLPSKGRIAGSEGIQVMVVMR